MGNFMVKFFGQKRESKLLCLGLDAAGKTTVLYQLKLGETVHTVPTIGFHVESVQREGLTMNIWDVGGQDKVRALWRYYFEGTDGLVFVVDSSDRERVAGPGDEDEEGADTARAELRKLLAEDTLRGVPVLVLANKQDLPTALSTSEVTERLGMYGVRDRKWFVQGANASRNVGLEDGFEWLSRNLPAKK